MPSTREMRLRIRSVKNLAQVTKALETVSASKVRRAIQAYKATQPYSEKAWKVLVHLARQPGHNSLHPLLAERKMDGERAGGDDQQRPRFGGFLQCQYSAANPGIFPPIRNPVSYVAVGRKGRDMLIRRRKDVMQILATCLLRRRLWMFQRSAAWWWMIFWRINSTQVYVAYTRLIIWSSKCR